MKINNYLLGAVILLSGSIFSCSDDDEVCPHSPDLSGINQDQFKADTTAIEEYLDENNIEARVHSSGLRYKIVDPGNGSSPDMCKSISIIYTGMLMSNGEIFDSSPHGQASVFDLSRLILGWQVGLPLIEEGGEIILYIPSQLAYGNRQVGSIPANSNLIFTIRLYKVE